MRQCKKVFKNYAILNDIDLLQELEEIVLNFSDLNIVENELIVYEEDKEKVVFFEEQECLEELKSGKKIIQQKGVFVLSEGVGSICLVGVVKKTQC